MLTLFGLACQAFNSDDPDHVQRLKSLDESQCFYQCWMNRVYFFLPGNATTQPVVYKWDHSFKHTIPTGLFTRWSITLQRDCNSLFVVVVVVVLGCVNKHRIDRHVSRWQERPVECDRLLHGQMDGPVRENERKGLRRGVDKTGQLP